MLKVCFLYVGYWALSIFITHDVMFHCFHYEMSVHTTMWVTSLRISYFAQVIKRDIAGHCAVSSSQPASICRILHYANTVNLTNLLLCS